MRQIVPQKITRPSWLTIFGVAGLVLLVCSRQYKWITVILPATGKPWSTKKNSSLWTNIIFLLLLLCSCSELILSHVKQSTRISSSQYPTLTNKLNLYLLYKFVRFSFSTLRPTCKIGARKAVVKISALLVLSLLQKNMREWNHSQKNYSLSDSHTRIKESHGLGLSIFYGLNVKSGNGMRRIFVVTQYCAKGHANGSSTFISISVFACCFSFWQSGDGSIVSIFP